MILLPLCKKQFTQTQKSGFLNLLNAMENGRRLPRDMILDVIEGVPSRERSEPLSLVTQDGKVECRHFCVPGASRGALWVGGIGNSRGTPVEALYTDSACTLTKEGITSLQVHFRHRERLQDSAYDVEAGLAYLHSKGIRSVALIGHSFGGAVVIRVASQISIVRTVITLAAQSLGAEEVIHLKPCCSILLLHGTEDTVVPCGCSQYLHRLAQTRKKLLLCPGADHNFKPLTDIVQQRVQEWICKELNED